MEKNIKTIFIIDAITKHTKWNEELKCYTFEPSQCGDIVSSINEVYEEKENLYSETMNSLTRLIMENNQLKQQLDNKS